MSANGIPQTSILMRTMMINHQIFGVSFFRRTHHKTLFFPKFGLCHACIHNATMGFQKFDFNIVKKKTTCVFSVLLWLNGSTIKRLNHPQVMAHVSCYTPWPMIAGFGFPVAVVAPSCDPPLMARHSQCPVLQPPGLGF